MATTGDDAIFVDTNVLVFANVAQHPLQAVALRRLNDLRAAGCELWISPQIVREFLVTLTRPQTYILPQPISSLAATAEYFLDHFYVADDTFIVTQELLSLITSTPVFGKSIHDANVVATMKVHGITRLLTHNVADFNRFSGLINLLPLTP